MSGMVNIAPEGLDEDTLKHWLTQAATFARTLPAKQ
jgi:hypothetical protein